MDYTDIKRLTDQNKLMRDKIYARGFYLTNDFVDDEAYPFYGCWQLTEWRNFKLLVHPKQNFHLNETNGRFMCLIGHAYDPFNMASDESVILKKLNRLFAENKSECLEKFNDLTGIFTLICIEDGKVYLVGDPAGMQTTFYSMKDDKIYISSHTKLLGDTLGLSMDPYVKELVGYKFFRLLGNSLPGDLTPYKRVKRLVPNHYVLFKQPGVIKIKRFYTPAMLQQSEEELAAEAAEIMHSNLQLNDEKWEKPAISLTGGCDSKTTLACANGLYDRFGYFSYISSEAERVDAEAAQNIGKALGLRHTIYNIPNRDEEMDGVQTASDILFWNTGGIRRSNPNDVRKRVFFADTEDFDVEVKSWASEIGRAYYSKRFHGRKNFGDSPTPRKCTTLYKFFLHNRKLVRETDEVFAKYLKRYFRQDTEHPVPWQEQFFWEFRMPSWNGLVITGEHRYSFDITIPYNNRRLLNILLSAPIDARINDSLYKTIRQLMNPAIDNTGISVTNLLHTEKREKAENLYYMIHSKLPF